jgi:RNA polymerase-binding transcription factor DksA
MAKWWIFKCQNCGKRVKEKFSKEDERTVDIEHIGIKTHIVSTHRCKDGKYGCCTLIGAEIRKD